MKISSYRNILVSCVIVVVVICCFFMVLSSNDVESLYTYVGISSSNVINSAIWINGTIVSNGTNEINRISRVNGINNGTSENGVVTGSTGNCWGNVVTVVSGGRMCNFIFEYASVWGLSKMFGLRPYVPDEIRQKLDQVFVNLDIPPISSLRDSPKCSDKHVNLEKSVSMRDLFPLDKTVKKIKSGDKPLVLWRWIVLQDVILPYAKELKKYFVFRPEIVAKAQKTLQNVHLGMQFNSPKQEILFVGVHIRRTDYLVYLEQHHIKIYADVGYYQRAVAWMDSILREHHKAENTLDIAYVVASDDAVWCKTVLIPQLQEDLSSINAKAGKSDVFYVGTHDDPILDLALLSSCNHSIISYGTYGMWSALMAGGWTVYYDVFVFNNKPEVASTGPMNFAKLLKNWRPLV